MSLILEQLIHREGRHLVVNRLSLEVDTAELFVLLGPHGSGKSAVLRITAGLLAAESGRVLLGGRDLTELPARQRGLGFVPRRAALFGRMTVAENVEFGLHIRKVAPAERRRTRDALLDLVGLDGLGSRMPGQLVDGQPQRVALARALAYQPQALLLDTPFGGLDRAARTELHATLLRIRHELGVPILFATNDPEEAFALADRLGIINAGRLIEVGTPGELYQRPRSEFAAMFLGPANLLVGQLAHGGVRLGPAPVQLSILSIDAMGPQRIPLLFRPEDVVLAAAQRDLAPPHLGCGVVEQAIYLGAIERLRIQLPALPGVRRIAPAVPFGADYLIVEASRTAAQARHFPLGHGDRVWVGVRNLHAILDAGLRLLIVTGPAPDARAALAFGRQITRLAHAQTTILEYPNAAERLGWGVQQAHNRPGKHFPLFEPRLPPVPPIEAVLNEVERCQYDLVVLAAREQDRGDLIEALLQVGEHHVLLVPSAQPTPERALICVTTGEPSKQDVLVAGRLLRHLGAEVTLLAVLPRGADGTAAHERAERFLAAGARTLNLLGVPART
ncbi:MAG TPA: ABC transporter ATP-binding protein, partial [Roseiflexaceae bacterium]|nr:ABC transporter ATP-binding protein [Roseiflexaceae bacterium]